jgi:hypothetical protein
VGPIDGRTPSRETRPAAIALGSAERGPGDDRQPARSTAEVERQDLLELLAGMGRSLKTGKQAEKSERIIPTQSHPVSHLHDEMDSQLTWKF